MRVKLLVARTGHDADGLPFQQAAGETIEVDDAEGKRLIDGNNAVEAEESAGESKGRGRRK